MSILCVGSPARWPCPGPTSAGQEPKVVPHRRPPHSASHCSPPKRRSQVLGGPSGPPLLLSLQTPGWEGSERDQKGRPEVSCLICKRKSFFAPPSPAYRGRNPSQAFPAPPSLSHFRLSCSLLLSPRDPVEGGTGVRSLGGLATSPFYGLTRAPRWMPGVEPARLHRPRQDSPTSSSAPPPPGLLLGRRVRTCSQARAGRLSCWAWA